MKDTRIQLASASLVSSVLHSVNAPPTTTTITTTTTINVFQSVTELTSSSLETHANARLASNTIQTRNANQSARATMRNTRMEDASVYLDAVEMLEIDAHSLALIRMRHSDQMASANAKMAIRRIEMGFANLKFQIA